MRKEIIKFCEKMIGKKITLKGLEESGIDWYGYYPVGDDDGRYTGEFAYADNCSEFELVNELYVR